MSATQMTVRGLAAGYHGFQVIQDLDLDVTPGVTVVLGPNGAGKTTLLKALAGLLPRSGDAVLDGVALPSADATACVRRGLALVAEGRQLFPQMTVTENLELGGWLIPARLRAERLARAFDDFPRLKERATQLAGTMSGGEQQMVAVARALMSGPRLLMLDEPSLGLAPRMVDELLAIVRRIADQGVTVLMVEQNVRKALQAADRGYVLERGRVVASGEAQALLHSDAVRQAYLGVA
ncbi:branched-chain amino acid transport system ATP-binding protein [Variovorax boronicumulans]|uniref:Branched-chain amino acid transport system ATP-binding protein n=1 Tax=Variovorax boronicumulans TaxID=436515 RepID=A0AAW8DXC8_9BURK|nr:ABC transporter ATP-binding protein [Variovorax boronicumulans]MDP9878698.1 branched-chain amino acid transport system ATP-binding protein [Variovorax boronicumulans]MDP9923982.1 branched-chain amino acid transport system ATP-binding protein [Variovorax boronicumulans]